MKTTVKNLESKEIIEKISRGEEIILIYRGKPYAKIIPFKETRKKRKRKLFGIWKDYKKVENVEEYIRGLRQGRFYAD